MRKLALLQTLTLILVLACGFIAGYAWPRVDRTREIVSYIEDCTLEDARAQRCTIPCGSEVDCVAKNGTRDGY